MKKLIALTFGMCVALGCGGVDTSLENSIGVTHTNTISGYIRNGEQFSSNLQEVVYTSTDFNEQIELHTVKVEGFVPEALMLRFSINNGQSLTTMSPGIYNFGIATGDPVRAIVCTGSDRYNWDYDRPVQNITMTIVDNSDGSRVVTFDVTLSSNFNEVDGELTGVLYL